MIVGTDSGCLAVCVEGKLRAGPCLEAWHRISYADAFAAALAQQLAAPVVTGDPELRDIEGEVAVEWLDQP